MTASKTRDDEHRFTFINSEQFAELECEHTWFIENVLVTGLPGVIGGPKKSLKTTFAVDMAVSLGTGTPFLGKFRVPRRIRTALLSGESGLSTLQSTARRVCAARGIPLSTCDVHWEFELPRLANDADRAELSSAIADMKAEVVIVDPLYLCLLDGATSLSATNLFDTGPVLRRTATACLDVGATPIFVHHMTKSAGTRDGKATSLEDLAFAGIGEFARQWLLINRLAEFDSRTGRHHLSLTIGGSAGQSSVHELHVEEGVMGANFAGRKWCVRIGSGDEHSPVAVANQRHRTRNRI